MPEVDAFIKFCAFQSSFFIQTYLVLKTPPFSLSNVIVFDRLLVVELLLWKAQVEKTNISSLLAYVTDYIQELTLYGSYRLSIIQQYTDERKPQLIWFTKTDEIFFQETST